MCKCYFLTLLDAYFLFQTGREQVMAAEVKSVIALFLVFKL